MLLGLQASLIKHRIKLYWLLTLAVAAIPLFANLDALPLRIYDEARLANNAYEMHKSGNLWVTTYEGMPDLWNTKPPLFIWLQVLFIKLLGYNEWALRLTSAISGLLICVVLIQFCKNYLNKISIGFFATIVLISSAGFVCIHGTRSGDYDILATYFMVLYCFSYFLYLEFKALKYVYSFGIVLGLAVLTKSVVGLMFLPGLAVYTILSGRAFGVLKDKHFYLSCFLTVVIIGQYYIYREILSPGYISAVKMNELGGRFLVVLEEHSQPFSYYWDNITKNHFNHWILVFIAGVIIGLFNNDKRIAKISLYSTCIILSYFLIISSAQTKLEWYAIPIYPFMALITAIAINEIMKLLDKIKISRHKIGFEILPLIFLIAITYEPYRKTIKSTWLAKEHDYEVEFYQISYFLKEALDGSFNLNGYIFTHDNYHPQTKAYVYMLNEKGINLKEKDYFKLENQDIAIVHQDLVKEYINKTYIFEERELFKNVVLYQVKGRKYVD